MFCIKQIQTKIAFLFLLISLHKVFVARARKKHLHHMSIYANAPAAAVI